MKEKILLDTDIGNDIDDSVCLAYLLRQRDCDLMGITTVSGEPEMRAELASAICRVAGRGDIPIYPGAANPLLTPQKQGFPKQVKYLPGWPHDTGFPKAEAVSFMRRVIRENPGEITLLAIGPMTNVALLFATDPEIPALLKKLVLMCGVFTYSYQGSPCLTEWNALCDPYATAMVYRAPVGEVFTVGLDVTGQVMMDKEAVIKRFDSDILKAVLAFSGLQDNTRKAIVFHDPLAAATIFEPEICGFKTGRVEVETGNPRLDGLTRWSADDGGNHHVAFSVNSERFFEHYFGVTR